MRTAVASKMIWGWVNELSDWRWPGNGGSAGFEMPKSAQRKPAILVTGPTEQQEDEEYMGSLPVEDVARYESRIDTIHRDMMELEVEDIKSHVLTNHILPLSRPGTPMSGMSRSSSMLASATTSYNKMEDISAVITAIVVQTLPNLAKLSRLLQLWSTRLRVLQQAPRLLRAIEDAEVALMSGWNAITAPANKSSTTSGSNTQERISLTREHFGVMKTVIEKKVTSGGRIADHMLDCLEGQADTIPDEWLDKLERVENDYAEWVAACERRVQETEWAKSKELQQPPEQQVATEKLAIPTEKSTVELPQIEDHLEQTTTSLEHVSAGEANYSPIGSNSLTRQLGSPEPEQTNGETPADTEVNEDSSRDRAIAHLDGADSDSSRLSLSPPLPIVSLADAEGATSEPYGDLDVPLDEDSAFPDLDDDVELPALHSGSRRDSVASQTSTVMHGASSHFGDSDMPEISASPDVVRMQIREAKYVNTSPPSSPPLPTEKSSGAGKKPANISVNGAVPLTEEAPRTPLDSSFADDYDDSFSVSEAAAGSPSKRRESSGDIQLRQQISQIIENIPAKIKLTSETPNVNLNPPDLQLPKMRKKPSIDRFRRSGSALSTVSSRSGTPAFTLSPAKNGRLSRAQRGQQEIKVYHLSRSTGEAPIKLFIRCVGENGERVMVRVGGGWADLSEYLKEYASHHKRRSAAADGPKVEIRDVPRVASGRGTAIGSSPPSRPGSALDSPLTPLNVRKPRRSSGAVGNEVPRLLPRTPAAGADDSLGAIPQSEDSIRSRSSSRLSWVEEDSSFLGLSGPNGKRVEMSDENKAWVESVKEKVRLASGERRVPPVPAAGSTQQDDVNGSKGRFGELGKVGGTKRLFRKSEDLRKK